MAEGRACAHCGTLFTARRIDAIYCGRSCKSMASHKRCYIPSSVDSRPCVVCGSEFTPAKYSKYCSPRCRGEARNRRAGARPRVPAADPRSCLTCGRRTTRGNFCSTKCFAAFTTPDVPCAECGSMFAPAPRGAQRYCSTPCRKRHGDRLGRELGKSWIVGTYKNTPDRRARADRRQALIRGATAPGEIIVRTEVFERDGWVCGLCGDDVDRDLNYPDPMSASLDHIVPVSLGGMHAMSNVQCSHLFCNLSKNNRVAA